MENSLNVQANISTGTLLAEIMRLPPRETENFLFEVQKNIKTKLENEFQEKINSYKKFVGICYKVRLKPYYQRFPKMYKYYKVINEHSSSENCVSTLTFTEYPIYWFDYQSSLSTMPQRGDFILGEYDFEGIHIEEKSVVPLEQKNIEIITEKEYNEAMNLYISRLQEMKWPHSHYRFGGKLPQDSDWETKEDE